MKRKGIYEYATIQDCIRYTGASPTSVRWVGANTGIAEEPNARRRLAAQDFAAGQGGDCFHVSMPPLEAKRTLLAKTADATIGSAARRRAAGRSCSLM